MSSEGPRRPSREPELPEPYESLIRWQKGAEPGSPTAEEARVRLMAILARDISRALSDFHKTTSRLNALLVVLTAVLVGIGALQVILAVAQRGR